MRATPDQEIQQRAFPFVRLNEREHKPRAVGITEIRGPCYTPLGRRVLENVLETMSEARSSGSTIEERVINVRRMATQHG